MNKTVNINIGGLFFNVDENAFQKLSRYFDAIKRSLSNAGGQEEIMKDIEMRVAELLQERQLTEKHVVNLADVDAVVAVMGQPEDYRIDDEETTTGSASSFSKTISKKLYRDKDNGLIGGVCTGLGHYFGVDAIWIKIALIIAVFAGFGTGILIYIILWAVTPNANTTSEKISMTGDPVTITNIEKKFREEYDSVSEKLKNANENVKAEFDQVSEKFKSSELGQKFNSSNKGSNLGDVIISIFKAFAKVIGAFIVMIASICLVAFCITGIIMMFSSTMPDNFIMNHISTPIGLETPLWIQGILFVLVFGIPFFFLLILGLKLLVTNLKSIGNVAKYTLLAL
jgi:phage shock protein PspC (stress-responsive transcriptional regulator)